MAELIIKFFQEQRELLVYFCEEIADIDYDEGEHDALVDAKNTAQLFVKMEREPVLVLNPHYSNQKEEETYNPFAALLSNYSVAV